MKTAFYTLLTGLLMAACITSYGQEIVSEFSPKPSAQYCDIVEASDGTLLIGSCTNLYSREYVVYKATTDGVFLDSTIFYKEYQLLEIPSVADNFLLVGFSREYSDNIYNLKLTLIDAELNTLRETLIPIGEYTYGFWDYNVFISPDHEIIFPYSTRSGDVFHIMRIGLDFTVLEDKAFPDIARGTWDHDNTCDSVVFYTEIDIFRDSPLTYHCLGFYKGANDTTVFVNHILDSEFNHVGTVNCSPYDENTVFTNEPLTAFTFLGEEQNPNQSYLMSTTLGSSYDTTTSIVKYNSKKIPVAMHRFTGNYIPYGPGQMVAKDYNTIYFTHSCIADYHAILLTRLDGDLNIAWELPLPSLPITISVLNNLKVLRNGDILVAAILYHYSTTPKLKIYIVSENNTKTRETEAAEKSVELYPNPVKEQLNLHFTEDSKPVYVELYDLQGHLVDTKCDGFESINMKAMPAGVYMLRITMKDGTSYHEKILKE